MTAVKLDGGSELLANLEKLQNNVGKGVADALLAGGKTVETAAKRLISTRSMGETVTRYRPGGSGYSHIVSAEGDAPNTDTGVLIRSIQTEVVREGVYVGTSTEYAPHLEFGTSKMAARPFLFPALQSKKGAIEKLVIKQLKAAIDDSAT